MTAINRLEDMVVEEVSIVDRAANKRRFLIVKRDTSMTATSKSDSGVAPAGAGAAGQGGAGQAAPAGAQSTNTATQKANGDGGAEGAGAADSILGSAVSALDVLTSLVESLSELGESDEANQKLASLAGSLVEIGQAIMAQAGGGASGQQGATGGAGQDPAATEAAKAAATEKAAKFDAAVSQVNGLVEKLAAAVTAAKTHPPEEFAKSKAGIEAAIKGFESKLGEVQKRVAQIEKHCGAPSSSTTESVTKLLDDTDVGWPMDLNSGGTSK
jgi:hypothetical protein